MFIRVLRRTMTAGFVAAVAIGFTSSSAWAGSSDNPGVNGLPIDWTIDTPYQDPNGQVIPLRVGQQDDKLVGGVGFGLAHIKQNHGIVPDAVAMDEAFNGDCDEPSYQRYVCVGDEATVVYSTNHDARSGDQYVFGIVTAFYNDQSGCGC